jgi:hypothetical protein
MGEFFRLCWGGKVVSLYFGGEGTKGVGVGSEAWVYGC